jgi:hypothetical protein
MTSISLILSCAAGFIVNLPGVLVWSEYGTIYAWEKERLGGSALEIMTWDPEHSPIILHVKILSEKYVSDIPLDHYRDTDPLHMHIDVKISSGTK